MKVLVVSSSTRIGRTSHRVALHLQHKLNTIPGVEATILDLAEAKLPVMEEVYARHPNPPAGSDAIAAQLADADAMLFVTPEYNGSYAPALKNLVDYYNKTEFIRKAIGIVTVTTGALGGMRAAMQMQQLILALFAYAAPHMLPVGNVTDKFDVNGNLLMPEYEKNVNNFVNEFLWLATAISAKKEAIPAG